MIFGKKKKRFQSTICWQRLLHCTFTKSHISQKLPINPKARNKHCKGMGKQILMPQLYMEKAQEWE